MTLYIWKIIELPFISTSDLAYKISFELFLFSPKDAKEFIKKAIHNGFLIVGDNDKLSPSDDLALELKNFQKKSIKLRVQHNIQINLKKMIRISSIYY